MGFYVILIVSLICGIVAVPIQKDLVGEDRCAVSCSEPTRFGYKVGNSYEFTYESDVITAADAEAREQTGLSVRANVAVDVLDTCELSLRVSNARLLQVGPSGQPVDAERSAEFARDIARNPLRFAFQDGRIDTLCPAADEPTWILNVKRAIVSGLQNTMRHTRRDNSNIEDDVNGRCTAHYFIEHRGYDSLTVRKEKNILGCSGRNNAVTAVQSLPYGDENERMSTPLLDSKHECLQTIHKDGYMTSSVCKESHKFQPFDKATSAASVRASHKLTFTRISNNVQSSKYARSSEPTSLMFDAGNNDEQSNRKKDETVDLLKQLCGATHHSDSAELVPQMLRRLISSMRTLDFSTLKQIYTMVHSEDACLHAADYFKDALPAIGSRGSVALISSLIENRNILGSEAKSWMSSLATVAKPHADMMESIKPLMKMNDVPRHQMLSLSSLVHRFCAMDTKCSDNVHVKEIIESLEARLGKSCKTVSDTQYEKMLIVLKSLANIGHGISAPALSECAASSKNPMDIRIAAVDAYRRVSCVVDRSPLMRILRDGEEDSEIRIHAYLAMMRCPTYSVLSDVKDLLENVKSNQVGSFIWTHLTNLMETDCPLKEEIKNLLDSEVLKKEFNKEALKFSRNFEWSTKGLGNVGGVADLNTIFSEKSFIPRSAALNLTANILGRQVNLLEAGGRVEGLESHLERFMQKAEGLRRNRRAAISQTKLDRIDNAYNVERSAAKGSGYMRMFGTELAFLDSRVDDIKDLKLIDVIMQLAKGGNVDVARSMQFLDTEVTIPTVAGIPVKLAVDGRASVHLKVNGRLDMRSAWTSPRNFEINGEMSPSAFVEINSRFSTDSEYVAASGLETRATLSTNFAARGQLKLSNGNDIKFNMELPQSKNEIIRFTNRVFINGAEKRAVDSATRDVCTGPVLSSVADVKLCAQWSYAKQGISMFEPVEAKLELAKTNEATKYTFEAQYDFAEKLHSEHRDFIQTAHILLDTPGSKTDRKILINFERVTPHHSVSMQVVTPWKTVDFDGKVTDSANSKQFEMTANSDNKQLIKTVARMEMSSNDRDWTYTPSLVIELPNRPVVQLTGELVHRFRREISGTAKLEGLTSKPVQLSAAIQKQPNAESGIRYTVQGDIKSDAITASLMSYYDNKITVKTHKTAMSYQWWDNERYSLDSSFKATYDTSKADPSYVVEARMNNNVIPSINFQLDASTSLPRTNQKHESFLKLTFGEDERISAVSNVDWTGTTSWTNVNVNSDFQIKYLKKGISWQLLLDHEHTPTKVSSRATVKSSNEEVLAYAISGRADSNTQWSADLKTRLYGRDLLNADADVSVVGQYGYDFKVSGKLMEKEARASGRVEVQPQSATIHLQGDLPEMRPIEMTIVVTPVDRFNKFEVKTNGRYGDEEISAQFTHELQDIAGFLKFETWQSLSVNTPWRSIKASNNLKNSAGFSSSTSLDWDVDNSGRVISFETTAMRSEQDRVLTATVGCNNPWMPAKISLRHRTDLEAIDSSLKIAFDDKEIESTLKFIKPVNANAFEGELTIKTPFVSFSEVSAKLRHDLSPRSYAAVAGVALNKQALELGAELKYPSGYSNEELRTMLVLKTPFDGAREYSANFGYKLNQTPAEADVSLVLDGKKMGSAKLQMEDDMGDVDLKLDIDSDYMSSPINVMVGHVLRGNSLKDMVQISKGDKTVSASVNLDLIDRFDNLKGTVSVKTPWSRLSNAQVTFTHELNGYKMKTGARAVINGQSGSVFVNGDMSDGLHIAAGARGFGEELKLNTKHTWDKAGLLKSTAEITYNDKPASYESTLDCPSPLTDCSGELVFETPILGYERIDAKFAHKASAQQLRTDIEASTKDKPDFLTIRVASDYPSGWKDAATTVLVSGLAKLDASCTHTIIISPAGVRIAGSSVWNTKKADFAVSAEYPGSWMNFNGNVQVKTNCPVVGDMELHLSNLINRGNYNGKASVSWAKEHISSEVTASWQQWKATLNADLKSSLFDDKSVDFSGLYEAGKGGNIELTSTWSPKVTVVYKSTAADLDSNPRATEEITITTPIRGYEKFGYRSSVEATVMKMNTEIVLFRNDNEGKLDWSLDYTKGAAGDVKLTLFNGKTYSAAGEYAGTLPRSLQEDGEIIVKGELDWGKKISAEVRAKKEGSQIDSTLTTSTPWRDANQVAVSLTVDPKQINVIFDCKRVNAAKSYNFGVRLTHDGPMQWAFGSSLTGPKMSERKIDIAFDMLKTPMTVSAEQNIYSAGKIEASLAQWGPAKWNVVIKLNNDKEISTSLDVTSEPMLFKLQQNIYSSSNLVASSSVNGLAQWSGDLEVVCGGKYTDKFAVAFDATKPLKSLKVDTGKWGVLDVSLNGVDATKFEFRSTFTKNGKTSSVAASVNALATPATFHLEESLYGSQYDATFTSSDRLMKSQLDVSTTVQGVRYDGLVAVDATGAPMTVEIDGKMNGKTVWGGKLSGTHRGPAYINGGVQLTTPYSGKMSVLVWGNCEKLPYTGRVEWRYAEDVIIAEVDMTHRNGNWLDGNLKISGLGSPVTGKIRVEADKKPYQLQVSAKLSELELDITGKSTNRGWAFIDSELLLSGKGVLQNVLGDSHIKFTVDNEGSSPKTMTFDAKLMEEFIKASYQINDVASGKHVALQYDCWMGHTTNIDATFTRPSANKLSSNGKVTFMSNNGEWNADIEADKVAGKMVLLAKLNGKTLDVNGKYSNVNDKKSAELTMSATPNHKIELTAETTGFMTGKVNLATSYSAVPQTGFEWNWRMKNGEPVVINDRISFAGKTYISVEGKVDSLYNWMSNKFELTITPCPNCTPKELTGRIELNQLPKQLYISAAWTPETVVTLDGMFQYNAAEKQYTGDVKLNTPWTKPMTASYNYMTQIARMQVGSELTYGGKPIKANLGMEATNNNGNLWSASLQTPWRAARDIKFNQRWEKTDKVQSAETRLEYNSKRTRMILTWDRLGNVYSADLETPFEKMKTAGFTFHPPADRSDFKATLELRHNMLKENINAQLSYKNEKKIDASFMLTGPYKLAVELTHMFMAGKCNTELQFTPNSGKSSTLNSQIIYRSTTDFEAEFNANGPFKPIVVKTVVKSTMNKRVASLLLTRDATTLFETNLEARKNNNKYTITTMLDLPMVRLSKATINIVVDDASVDVAVTNAKKPIASARVEFSGEPLNVRLTADSTFTGPVEATVKYSGNSDRTFQADASAKIANRPYSININIDRSSAFKGTVTSTAAGQRATLNWELDSDSVNNFAKATWNGREISFTSAVDMPRALNIAVKTPFNYYRDVSVVMTNTGDYYTRNSELVLSVDREVIKLSANANAQPKKFCKGSFAIESPWAENMRFDWDSKRTSPSAIQMIMSAQLANGRAVGFNGKWNTPNPVDHEIDVEITTPSQALKKASFSTKIHRSGVAKSISVVCGVNDEALLDATVQTDVPRGAYDVITNAPRAMKYRVELSENEAKASANWNTKQAGNKVDVNVALTTAGNKKTVSVECRLPSRNIKASAFVDATEFQFNHGAEMVLNDGVSKKFGYGINLVDKTSGPDSLYEMDVTLENIVRSIRLTAQHSCTAAGQMTSSGKFAYDLSDSAKWVAVENKLRLVGNRQANIAFTVTGGKIPDPLKIELDMKRGRMLEGKLTTSMGGKANMVNIKLYNLKDNATAEVTVRVPDMSAEYIAHIGAVRDRMSTGFHMKHTTRSDEQTAFWYADACSLADGFSLTFDTPLKSVEMRMTREDTNGGKKFILTNVYDKTREVKMVVFVNADKKFAGAQLFYDPENPNKVLNLKAAYINQSAYEVELFRSVDDKHITDALVMVNLNNSRLMHMRLFYRPESINEFTTKLADKRDQYYAFVERARSQLMSNLERPTSKLVPDAVRIEMESEWNQFVSELNDVQSNLAQMLKNNEFFSRDVFNFIERYVERVTRTVAVSKAWMMEKIRIVEMQLLRRGWNNLNIYARRTHARTMEYASAAAKSGGEFLSERAKRSWHLGGQLHQGLKHLGNKVTEYYHKHKQTISDLAKSSVEKYIIGTAAGGRTRRSVEENLGSYKQSMIGALNMAHGQLMKNWYYRTAVNKATELSKQVSATLKDTKFIDSAIERSSAYANDIVQRSVNSMTPRNPVTVWQKGEAQLDFALPLAVDSLQSLNKVDFAKKTAYAKHWANYYWEQVKDWRATTADYVYGLVPESIYPSDWFAAHGSIYGDEHYMTFDHHAYAFRGTCSYVLARDMLDEDFSVAVDYEKKSGEFVRKSLDVTVKGLEGGSVKLMRDGTVRMSGENIDLPVALTSDITLEWFNGEVVFNSPYVKVMCNADLDYCTLRISATYHSRVAGLFGSFDNEWKNDWTAANGRVLKNVESFTGSWEASSGKCKHANKAVEQVEPVKEWVSCETEMPSGHGIGDRLCKFLFSCPASPMSRCFKKVPPMLFMKKCISSRTSETDKRSICGSVEAYAKECARHDVRIRVPRPCSRRNCAVEDGSQSATQSADVIVVVQESSCNALNGKLNAMLTQVEQQLQQQGLSANRFGLVGFGGEGIHDKPHTHTVSGQQFGALTDIKKSTDGLVFGKSGQWLNVDDALKFAANTYAFRSGVKKMIVVAACPSCKWSWFSFGGLKSQLQTEDFSVHLLTDSAMDTMKEKVQIYGYNKEFAFTSEKSKISRSEIRTTVRNECTQIALDTEGTVFSSAWLNSRGHSDAFIKTFAKAASSTAKPAECQRCSCQFDGLFSRSICVKC